MRKPRQGEEDKLFLISLIKEEKDVLIGPFDIKKGITQEARCEKWKEIFEQVVSRGMNLGDHGWKHIRDVVWPNLRRSATVIIII